VPADKPLIEGLIKRAKAEGLRRFVARHKDNGLGHLAQAELDRRASEDRAECECETGERTPLNCWSCSASPNLHAKKEDQQ